MERWATGSALRTVGALINVVVFTIFGMLGGLLGVAIFKKNAPPQPPGTVEVLPPE
jgi:ABC-type multidrug transport system permease subunit